MPVGLLCVLACTSTNDLNLLERETLRFKDENERIRAEDLLARYEKRKQQADALSEKLLTIQRERETAFAQYDALRGELARLERRRATAEEERAAAQAALAAARSETKRLAAELMQERAAIERLQAELEKMQAQIRALEAQKTQSTKVEE